MARKIKAWGLQKCDTTTNAITHIKSKGVAVEFTDYSVEKPTVAKIERWAKKLGGWEKLINRASYTWRGLDPSETKDLDNHSAAVLASKHTSLIRRPLIEHEDGTVTAGFTPKVKALF
jgi:Spx/MgsR family transcriptional regulator